jgi:hypothetical protein
LRFAQECAAAARDRRTDCRTATLCDNLVISRLAMDAVDPPPLDPNLPNVASPESFPLDAGRRDDRPPFLDVGLHERPECLRRLLLTRENLQPEFHEPRADCRVS